MGRFWETEEHKKLISDSERLQKSHLRELLKHEKRNDLLTADYDGIHIDATRQLVDVACLENLKELIQVSKVNEKIQAMFKGEKINSTEQRSVLHVALRSSSNDEYKSDGADVVKEVHDVLEKIKSYSENVRTGKALGHTGKKLKDVICIGIGGSYLGVEFVFEALRTHKESAQKAHGRKLHFLANVDPIDVHRALENFDPETTLVVVISKTFTTAETMLNAKTIKNWLISHLKDQTCIAKHVCAVSTNIEGTNKFGVDPKNVFGFWDWVGGRFSVCSAVGVLPLALQYGYDSVAEFLEGARDIDLHFKRETDLHKNLPLLMGALSFFNSTYHKYNNVAVLPYCQALLRFPAHIQQLTMESNGKGVTLDGTALPSTDFSGEIYFGEPGTNGQHSFYQLIHQGRVMSCEFIGFTKSQQEASLPDEVVPNHDELMSNFFAQPDALALGKTAEQLKKENVPESLIAHKTFRGNRPSTCILFEGELTPRRTGQLLALYEHRTAVEGFLWGINSFDQWGVELGKVLAKDIRNIMAKRNKGEDVSSQTDNLIGPTQRLLKKYFASR